MKKVYCDHVMKLVTFLLMWAAFGNSTTTKLEKGGELACVNGGGGTITLSFGFYLNSCPQAEAIIFSWVQKALFDDPRMPASLLRLHFHDCIVNGCDASVLLDDTPSFTGEKTAAPNANSLRGFEVIDAIKADLEYVCPQTVSCADILAVAARDAVLLSGGPGWEVQLGRKDSLSASKTAANSNIPSPNSDLPTLLSKFQNAGLSLQDLIALSGAHTMGKARCSTFNSRFINNASSSSSSLFLQSLQQLCSSAAGGNNATQQQLADLDYVTPTTFDNQYYVNLLSGEGVLGSDEVLMQNMTPIIQSYAHDVDHFFDDFKKAMLTMGTLANNAAAVGEIRTNCRLVNHIIS